MSNNNTGYINWARYLTARRAGEGRGQIPAPLGHVPPFLRRQNHDFLANVTPATRIALTGTPFPRAPGDGPVPAPAVQAPPAADSEAQAEEPEGGNSLAAVQIPVRWLLREVGFEGEEDEGYSSLGDLAPEPPYRSDSQASTLANSPASSLIFNSSDDDGLVEWTEEPAVVDVSFSTVSLVFPDPEGTWLPAVPAPPGTPPRTPPSQSSEESTGDLHEPEPEAGEPVRRRLTNTDVSLFSDVRDLLLTHADADGNPVLLDLDCLICLERSLLVPEPVAPRRPSYLRRHERHEGVSVLPCGHFFGTLCYHRWEFVNAEGRSPPHCPLCRRAMVYPVCRHRIPVQVADGVADVLRTVPEGGHVADRCTVCDPHKPAGSW